MAAIRVESEAGGVTYGQVACVGTLIASIGPCMPTPKAALQALLQQQQQQRWVTSWYYLSSGATLDCPTTLLALYVGSVSPLGQPNR